MSTEPDTGLLDGLLHELSGGFVNSWALTPHGESSFHWDCSLVREPLSSSTPAPGSVRL
jgi:hypothetical protein